MKTTKKQKVAKKDKPKRSSSPAQKASQKKVGNYWNTALLNAYKAGKKGVLFGANKIKFETKQQIWGNG